MCPMFGVLMALSSFAVAMATNAVQLGPAPCSRSWLVATPSSSSTLARDDVNNDVEIRRGLLNIRAESSRLMIRLYHALSTYGTERTMASFSPGPTLQSLMPTLQPNATFSQLYNSLCQMHSHLSTVQAHTVYLSLVRADDVDQVRDTLFVILVRMSRVANMANIWVPLDQMSSVDRTMLSCNTQRRYRRCRRLRDFIFLEHTTQVVRQLETTSNAYLQ